MKKLFLVAFIAAAFLSCKKNSDDCRFSESPAVAPASEIAAVQAYLASQSITTATQHPSGLFYEINAAGTGTKPSLCSGVNVKYIGKLTNGTTFDSNLTGASFTLGDLIIGWQKGLPLIGSGGIIRLFIPPSLGYGSQASGPIPANSILVFDLQLVNVF